MSQSIKFWDAIVAWLNMINSSKLKRISKSNYISGMLQLINSDVIDPIFQIKKLNPQWLSKASSQIDSFDHWSISTKKSRKTCLNSFYDFSLNFICFSPRKVPSKLEIESILNLNFRLNDKSL